MTYPTTVRGLLGYFLRSTELTTADQRVSPPPIQLPKYSSLQAILTDGAGGGGARGVAGGCRSLRGGRGGDRLTGGRSRDGRVMARGKEG